MAHLKTWFDIIGRDMASPAIAKVGGAMRGMGAQAAATNARMAKMPGQLQRAFSPMIDGGMFMKAGGAITDFVGKTVDQAGDLEFALAELKGISQATAPELTKLAEKAKKLGVETQFTPKQAIEGLTALAQQGFTTAQQLSAVESSLLLAGASGGRVPLAEASKLTAQTLKAFQREAGEAGITVDQLVKTTTLSGLAIDELSAALQNASSGAIAMGLDVGESMAALGLIKNIIPSAQMAGSAFQIMTQRLSDPRVQRMLDKAVGVQVIDEATGKYKDFGTTLVGLSEGLMKLEEGERGALIGEAFGARAKKGILSIMVQLHKGVTTNTGEVVKGQAAWDLWMKNLDPETVKGFASELNELKLDTLNGQVILLTGSVQTLMAELGKGTAGVLKSGVKMFLGLFNSILEVFQGLPQPVKNVMSMFLALAGVVLKVVGTVFLLKGVMSLLGVSFGGVLFSIAKILLLSAPLILFFGAMAVGIYAIYRSWSQNLDGIGSSWSDLWGKVKLGFRGVMDLIKTGGLSQGVIDELQKVENKGVAGFLRTAVKWLANIRAFFRGLTVRLDVALGRLEEPLNRLKGTIGNVFGRWFEDTEKGVKSTDKWAARGSNMADVLVTVAESAITLMDMMIQLGAAISERVTLDDIIDGFETMLTLADLLVKAVQGLIDRLMWLGSIRQGGTALAKQLYGAERTLTEEEMLAGMSGLGSVGGGGRRRLEMGFANIRKLEAGGLVSPQRAQELKVGEFKRQQTMTAATAVPGGGGEEARGKLDRMMEKNTKAVDKWVSTMGKVRVVKANLNVDGRSFGEVILSLGGQSQEEGYEEPYEIDTGVTVHQE